MNNHKLFCTLEEQADVNRDLREKVAKRLFTTAPRANWKMPVFASLGVSLAVVVVLLGFHNPISNAPTVQAVELFAKASASLSDGFNEGKWLMTTYLVQGNNLTDNEVTSWSDGHGQQATIFANGEDGDTSTQLQMFSVDDNETDSIRSVLTEVDNKIGGETIAIDSQEGRIHLATEEIRNTLAAIYAVRLNEIDCNTECMANRINYDVVGEENLAINDGQIVESYKLTSRINSPYSHNVTSLWLQNDNGNLLKITESTPDGQVVYTQTTTVSSFVAKSELPRWIKDGVENAERVRSEE